MTKWILLFALLAPTVSMAQFDETSYYTIRGMEVTKVKSETVSFQTFNSQVIGSGSCATSGSPVLFLNDSGLGGVSDILAAEILEPLNTFEIIFDKVVNLGKKVWGLVELGKPVVNLTTDIGTAMPQGSRCWMDLETWQTPRSETYAVSYKNLYGMEVVHFDYRVMYIYGGSLNGKGAYIGYAAIMPSNVKVSWGFEFNAKASVPATFNMGTKDNPVGGMTLEMQYTVKPKLPIQVHQSSQVFHITGNGVFQKLK